jgi:hypothetical protein
MIRVSDHNILLCLSIVLVSVMGLEVTTCDACAQDDDQTLREQFLREAPARWAEYVQQAKQLQGTYSFRASFSVTGTKAENTYTVKMNRTCKLIELSMARKTPGGQGDYDDLKVVAFNPRYAFALKRKTPSSPWIVTELVDLRTNSLPSSIQKTFERIDNEILELVRLDKDPLAELARKPEFQVVRCKKVLQAGEEFVQVDFEYPPTVEERDSGVHRGTLVLDPQRFWCLRSYEVRYPRSDGSPGTVKYRVLELGGREEGLPVPKRALEQREFLSKDGTRGKTEIWVECNLDVPRTLPPDEEFTLSAFGLPEPLGVTWSKPTPWYLWLSLAGALCLGGSGVFYWLKRRAAAKAH